MQLVIVAVGIVIAIIVIIKTVRKINFYDEYEMNFEEKHKGNFISRFETNSFDWRHHID